MNKYIVMFALSTVLGSWSLESAVEITNQGADMSLNIGQRFMKLLLDYRTLSVRHQLLVKKGTDR